MRAEGRAPGEALQVDQFDLTKALCTRPQSLKVTHSPICGKVAVARLPLGFTGQLTTIWLCRECRDEVAAKYPDVVQYIQPV